MYLKKNPILSCVLLLALACWTVACARPTPTPMPVQPTASPVPTAAPTVPLLKTYSSVAFGISLEYPADWEKKPVAGERYEGSDGFFEISLISREGWTIDEVADAEVFYRIQPYASLAHIESLQLEGREARLFMSAGDALKDTEGQAWVVVHLPRPIQIAGQRCDYLLLWADQYHIGEIARSIRFR